VVVVVVVNQKKSMVVGKNVTLKIENIYTIQNYQYKTRRNFSQTLNIIVEEWDKFSIMIDEIKARQKQKDHFDYLDKIRNAEVIKDES